MWQMLHNCIKCCKHTECVADASMCPSKSAYFTLHTFIHDKWQSNKLMDFIHNLQQASTTEWDRNEERGGERKVAEQKAKKRVSTD